MVNYSSSYANSPKDYVVEPYAFTRDYVDIWACDTASKHNKTFKISRMEHVEMLGGWQMEDKHRPKPIDSFRMSGEGLPIEHVKLKLSLRAKNLLTEEFPITEYEITQNKRSWLWEGDINAFEGIGRLRDGFAEGNFHCEGGQTPGVGGNGDRVLKKEVF